MAEMVLSADYKTAVELDQRIKTTAKTFTEDFIQLCRLLDEMCSKKLYKEFGYQTFYDYCDKEIGLKPTQSKKWAKIGEGFKENGQSTVHFGNLGTEKLYLLAKLDEPEREEIQQNVNIEDVSVKKLKAEIERLKEQSKKNERELSEENHELNCRCNSLVAEMNQLKDDNDKIRSAKISVESDLLSVKSNNRSLRHQLDDAEKKIADLESRPVEVAVVEDKDAQAQIKQLSRELSEADQNHVNAMEEQRIKYQKQINQLESQLEKQKDIQTVKVPDVDAILTPCVNNLSTAMEMLIKSLEEINDPSLIKEAGKTVDDYRWKMDDIFDIFDEKLGN